jgi:tRNA nucleotidyltransferase (CCA-adding enzyme)
MNPYIENPIQILEKALEAANHEALLDEEYREGDLIWEAGRKGAVKKIDGADAWRVFCDAMLTDNPRNFFDFLFANDILHLVFPEVYRMKGAIESQKWHPEGNAYEHTMLVLQRAAYHRFDLPTRIACLVHDFGKALTPIEEMPRHYGHDDRGMQPATGFMYRFGTLDAKELARPMRLMCKYHMRMHNLKNLRDVTIVRMIKNLVSKDNANMLMNLSVCDTQGRLGSENEDITFLLEWVECVNAYATVDANEVAKEHADKGQDVIAQKIEEARASAVKAARRK